MSGPPSVKLGAGSGYWGAELEQPLRLVTEGEVDFLGFDCLAELTMSLLERQRLKDPKRGYIPDVLRQMDVLLPHLRDHDTRIVTNGGGANCAQAIADIADRAHAAGHQGIKLAAVYGDDVLERLDPLRADGWTFANLDTGVEDIGEIRERIVSAHAYLGADGIVTALDAGADVVVTGRVSDNALYVGPLRHALGWSADDVDRIGAAVTIGHVIECAELCCGGMTNLWEESPRPWEIGFPIAEVAEDGTCVVTKLPGTGGLVNAWTIKEHLVYEVHDPARYLMPDGVADLTAVRVEDLGDDRVRLSNMRGGPAPDTLKVQIGYHDGWIAEGLYVIGGPRVLAKARHLERLYRELVARIGITPLELRFDRIGVDALSDDVLPEPAEDSLHEVGIRIAVRAATQDEAKALRAEMLRLTVYGPVGVAWNAPPPIRPVISLWPTLIPRSAIDVRVETRDVR